MSFLLLLLLRLAIGEEEEIGVGLLGYVLLGCGCSPPDGYGALDPLKEGLFDSNDAV